MYVFYIKLYNFCSNNRLLCLSDLFVLMLVAKDASKQAAAYLIAEMPKDDIPTTLK